MPPCFHLGSVWTFYRQVLLLFISILYEPMAIDRFSRSLYVDLANLVAQSVPMLPGHASGALLPFSRAGRTQAERLVPTTASGRAGTGTPPPLQFEFGVRSVQLDLFWGDHPTAHSNHLNVQVSTFGLRFFHQKKLRARRAHGIDGSSRVRPRSFLDPHPVKKRCRQHQLLTAMCNGFVGGIHRLLDCWID